MLYYLLLSYIMLFYAKYNVLRMRVHRTYYYTALEKEVVNETQYRCCEGWMQLNEEKGCLHSEQIQPSIYHRSTDQSSIQ